MEFTIFGVLTGLALFAALFVTFVAGSSRGVRYGGFIRFAALCLPMAFLFSRALFCLASTSYYLEELGTAMPELMLQVLDGGYSMTGAILGAALAALICEKWQKLPAGSLTDALALGLPVGVIIVRLAQPLCDFGWGYQYESPSFAFLDELDVLFRDDVLQLHPVFLYEALAGAAILGLLALMRTLRRMKGGDLLLCFLLFYGAAQTVLESMLDSEHMKVIHFVRINQIAAMVMMVIPLIVWSIRLGRRREGNALRIVSLWVTAVMCILAGVVQEFGVAGASNPYFDIPTVGSIVVGLLVAAVAAWCVLWHKAGMMRLAPAAAVTILIAALTIIDRTRDVGLQYRLILWGTMGAILLLMCLTGLTLGAAAGEEIDMKRNA